MSIKSLALALHHIQETLEKRAQKGFGCHHPITIILYILERFFPDLVFSDAHFYNVVIEMCVFPPRLSDCFILERIEYVDFFGHSD